MPSATFSRPMQFGPCMSSDTVAATLRSSVSCSGVNPAVMTTAERTPARSRRRITSATSPAGTATKATSTSGGSASMAGMAGRPSSSAAWGWIGRIVPGKPWAWRLRMARLPRVARRAETPRTQIERGRSSASMPPSGPLMGRPPRWRSGCARPRSAGIGAAARSAARGRFGRAVPLQSRGRPP